MSSSPNVPIAKDFSHSGLASTTAPSTATIIGDDPGPNTAASSSAIAEGHARGEHPHDGTRGPCGTGCVPGLGSSAHISECAAISPSTLRLPRGFARDRLLRAFPRRLRGHQDVLTPPRSLEQHARSPSRLFAPTAEIPRSPSRWMTLNIPFMVMRNLDTGQWCADPAGVRRRSGTSSRRSRRPTPTSSASRRGRPTSVRSRSTRVVPRAAAPADLASRFVDPPGANGAYVLAEVATGRFVAVSNVHLLSDPYGPYWVRDGEPRARPCSSWSAPRAPAGDSAGARRPGAGRRRHAGVPHRGLQLTIPPGLDPRGRRRPRGGPVPGLLAGLRRPGRCGLP